MKNKVLKWLLFAFTFVYAVYMGGGLFEAVVIVPVWSASAEAARAWNSNPLQVIEGARFFLIANPLSTLLALPLAILGWNAPGPMRLWLRLVMVIYFAVFIATAGYFVPEQLAIKGVEATRSLTDAELVTRLSRWAALNLVRSACAFVMLFGSLKALVYSRALEEAESAAERAAKGRSTQPGAAYLYKLGVF
jgi:hypothetical protein